MHPLNVVTIAGYANNSDFLNHCIIGFLKRICNPKGLNLEPMLYQVHDSNVHTHTQPSGMGINLGRCLQVCASRQNKSSQHLQDPAPRDALLALLRPFAPK